MNVCLNIYLGVCVWMNVCLNEQFHWSSKLEILEFEIQNPNFKGQGEQYHYNVQVVALSMINK